jgi:D-galactarolactone isomerase
VSDGACFVKLSAPYRLSLAGAPWADVVPLARALADANPGRCLWATDWPHTQYPAVDDDALTAALVAWCPDERARRVILSETPALLYG